LPYASPSANGGEHARSIVVSRANRDLDLWNDGNETITFGHVVESVLKDLSAVRKAVTKQQEDRGLQMLRHGLRGWDFNDLAERRPEVIQKELPRDEHESPWWGFRMRMACWSFSAKGLVGLYGLKLTPI
jgi:hypothetical protein